MTDLDEIVRAIRALDGPRFRGIVVPRRMFLRSSFATRKEWKRALAIHARYLNLPICKIKEFARP